MVKDNGTDVDAYMHGWTDGSMHGCKDAWMRGCMKESAATKTSKSTFCCCGLWRLQGQNIVFLVFVAAISCSHPQKPKRRGTQKRKGRVVENPRPNPQIYPKSFPNLSKTIPNLPKTLPKSLPNLTKSKEIESAATKTVRWGYVRGTLGVR